jgi:apolipoprotein N-acyltransferase
MNNKLSVGQQSLFALLSGVLLSLAFLDADLYLFTWVAFIPFLMAIQGASTHRTYCLGLISGLAFSISAAYWLIDFLMLSKGYDLNLAILWSLVFWFYCAQLSALIAVIFNWLKQRSPIHEFLLFPLVVVTLYSAFPMLFTVRLGESQSEFLTAIQATSFTGVHGLDAVIALCNIMLFKLSSILVDKQLKRVYWPWLLASIPLTAWFSYGLLVMPILEKEIAAGKTIRIGIVQPNEIPTLAKSKPYPGYSRAFPPEMAMTERLATDGAEIVIWPEAKYKAYFDRPHVQRAYREQLNTLKTSLVFQDIEHQHSEGNSSTVVQFNTALMLNNKGVKVGQYQKMKRIAFGEYVPLVSDIPALRSWVEGFFGQFLNEMEKGKSHQVFSHEKLTIIPLICYELMFPSFVAEAVSEAFPEKKDAKSLPTENHNGGILVGLSSNGWFGTTRQPFQHVNASILRAVENRMPLVHAVNNGPSIVALANGRVMFISDYHQAGGYIVDVPYTNETKGSYFSRHSKLFIYSAYSALFIIILASSTTLRRQRRV